MKKLEGSKPDEKDKVKKNKAMYILFPVETHLRLVQYQKVKAARRKVKKRLPDIVVELIDSILGIKNIDIEVLESLVNILKSENALVLLYENLKRKKS